MVKIQDTLTKEIAEKVPDAHFQPWQNSYHETFLRIYFGNEDECEQPIDLWIKDNQVANLQFVQTNTWGWDNCVRTTSTAKTLIVLMKILAPYLPDKD